MAYHCALYPMECLRLTQARLPASRVPGHPSRPHRMNGILDGRTERVAPTSTHELSGTVVGVVAVREMDGKRCRSQLSGAKGVGGVVPNPCWWRIRLIICIAPGGTIPSCIGGSASGSDGPPEQ